MLIIGLLIVVIALQGVILWRTSPAKSVKPSMDVETALLNALTTSRLPTADLDTDLTTTGKLGDVLYHTASNLDRPLRTARDLHNLFVK